MPPDARVDDGCTRLLNLLGEQHNLFPRATILNQVEHRQAINDDEVAPHRFAGTSNDFGGKPNAVFVRPTPLVFTLVGMINDELVDEVTLRTHEGHMQYGGYVREELVIDADWKKIPD